MALTGMHLVGEPVAMGLILASLDPVALDAVGSGLLGHDPGDIEYLRPCDGVLGRLDDIRVLTGRGGRDCRHAGLSCRRDAIRIPHVP